MGDLPSGGLQLGLKLGNHAVFPLPEVPCQNMLSRCLYKPEVKTQIVDGGDLPTKRFIHMKKVPDIGLAVTLVDTGIAMRVQWTEVLCPFGIPEIDDAN